VTERNISQFLEGSFGLLSNHDGGIPVYRRIVLTPDFLIGVDTASDDEDIQAKKKGRGVKISHSDHLFIDNKHCLHRTFCGVRVLNTSYKFLVITLFALSSSGYFRIDEYAVEYADSQCVLVNNLWS